MRIFSCPAIVIAMLVFGNTTNAQEQSRQGQRVQRGNADDAEAERRKGDRNREARSGGSQDQQGARGGGGQGRGRGGGQPGGGGLFRLLDVDRDGQLSAKEIDGAIAVLSKLDTNKDGVLDGEELNVRGGGGRGGQGGERKDQGAQASPRRGGQIAEDKRGRNLPGVN